MDLAGAAYEINSLPLKLLSYAGIIQIRSKGLKNICFSLSPSRGTPSSIVYLLDSVNNNS